MRSKMLGLAIALSTFGLGVAATTLWIAHSAPQQEIVMRRTVFVPSGSPIPTEGFARRDSQITSSISGTRIVDGLIVGSVPNGGALSAPKPIYPPLAREAGVSGTVIVAAKIDKSGNVVSAKAVSGPQPLRQAATDAVMKWSFLPTLVSGKAIKVMRTVTFNFLCQ
jgi:TonB family protein